MGRTTRALALLVVTGATVVVVVRGRRRRTADRIERAGDVVPGSADRRDELVDDSIDDSFPASDPPSYWGRETEVREPG